MAGVLALSANSVLADEYTIEDFHTKLFWKRPDQGK